MNMSVTNKNAVQDIVFHKLHFKEFCYNTLMDLHKTLDFKNR